MNQEFDKQQLVKLLEAKVAGGIPAEPVRLLNGRGGTAPGFDDLNMDYYPPLVFAALYNSFSDSQLSEIRAAVNTVIPSAPLIIQDRSVRPAFIRLRSGDVPDEMVITENGLSYLLHPGRGQNPGFFIDMRDCRNLLRDMISAAGAGNPGSVSVLNLFAYTCAFSVAAAASGAGKIVNIDMNRRSLDIGRRNHQLNSGVIPGGYGKQAKFLPHDIFKSIGRLKREGPYSLIIADPPPTQKGSFMLLRDYPKLIRRLPEMLQPGGRILLSHNGPGWNWEEFEEMVTGILPAAFSLRRIDPPADFAPLEPGRGLKILIAEL